jgi:hypothetical protein
MTRACSPPDNVPSRASSGSALTPRRSRISAARAAYAELLIPLLHGAEFVDVGGIDAGRVAGSSVGRDRHLKHPQPPIERRQLARRLVEECADRHGRVGHLLREVADPHGRRQLDVPGGRAHLAGDDLQES